MSALHLAATLVAQTAGTDLIGNGLVQFGALGLLALAALAGLRVVHRQTAEAAKADRERADRLEQELRTQNANFQDKILTVLTGNTHVMQQVLDEMREDRR